MIDYGGDNQGGRMSDRTLLNLTDENDPEGLEETADGRRRYRAQIPRRRFPVSDLRFCRVRQSSVHAPNGKGRSAAEAHLACLGVAWMLHLTKRFSTCGVEMIGLVG